MRHLFFALLLLACCVPSLSAKDAKEEKRVIPQTRLAPGQGMVMMRVIATTDISDQSRKWEKFDVTELKTGKTYKIGDLYYLGHHAIFVASLPPGDYRADRVRLGDKVWQSLAEYGYADFHPAGGWSFRIEAGRMTNLGSMLYLQEYVDAVPKVNIWAGTRTTSVPFHWVYVPDESLPQRNAHLFHPDDHPAVLSKALGWTSVSPAATLSSVPPQFKRLTLSLSGATPANGGGTLFGEHFGQVAWRHADGNWSWEDTGTIESIRLAADSPDGSRYAAAEGSILLKRHGVGDWRRIPVELEDATPCLMYAHADGSLLTVWEQFSKYTALRYRADGNPAWTTEWEMPAPRDKVRKYLGLCKSSQTPKGIVVTSQMILFAVSTRRFATLDLPGGAWTHIEEGIKGAIGMMPDGALFSMTGGLSNQTFKVSANNGTTWEDRSTGSNLLGQPQFRTPEEGFTLGITPNVSWVLFRTTDGGRSWSPFANLPKRTNWLLVLPGQEVLAATESGQLFGSPDNGKHWRLERDASSGL